MQAKTHSYQRSQRLQTIWFSILGGIISAALAAGMIYFIYTSSHLRG